MQKTRALGNPYATSREIKFFRLVESGHFGHLASDKGHTCLFAAGAYTLHKLFHTLGIIFADAYVIEEKEGLRALREDVVCAHSHAINTNAIEDIELLCQKNFGAYPVGTRNQNRFIKVKVLQRK